MKLGELQKLAQVIPNTPGADAHQKLQEHIRSLGLDPNSLYQELEMASRFVDTHRDTSFSNAHMQLHSHAFFELLYCCNSCGAEYLVGSERYRLQAGDVIFVPPGVSHRPLLPEQMSEPYHRYVLWLSQEFMDWYAQLFPGSFSLAQGTAGLLRTGGSLRESIGERFRSGIREAEHRADGWEAAVIGNTMMLLSQILRATNTRAIRTMHAEEPELLDKLAAHLEQNYASRISIQDLAKQFYVSSSTVSHLFKQKMGISFYRYVTQRRLIAAKSLIEKGLLLEDVGSQAGFSDYSSFYRAFKQEYGISPRQYRSIQEAQLPGTVIRSR